MKCEIHLHNGTLACLERSGHCQVSSRSPGMAFDDGKSSLRGVPRNHSNASLVTKDYSRQSRALSTERVSFQTSNGAVVLFHISLWLNGSSYDYIITLLSHAQH